MSFAELTRARYSCRSYEQRPVPQDAVDAIVEAGRIAPSAHNNHPTRIIVCDTEETRKAAASAAYRFDRDGSVFGAPLVLLVCAQTDAAWVRAYDGMSASLIDTTIVCDQMMMQATELGLGTCWVCMFDPDIARTAFSLPENLLPVSMLTVGYPADTIAEPDRREARRIPRDEFVIKR